MHRVIVRGRKEDTINWYIQGFLPDGKKEMLGPYTCYIQHFETEAEARSVVLRSIMNIHWDHSIMIGKMMNFMYHNFYESTDVFVTYDNNVVTKKINNAAEERNH